jgi:hypothetical protein
MQGGYFTFLPSGKGRPRLGIKRDVGLVLSSRVKKRVKGVLT